ncbi:MAG: hypothetical protein ABIJ45_04665 [Candidatus Zixiibacteriota bacterium]
MYKFLIILLILSILANIAGLYIFYKYYKTQKHLERAMGQLADANNQNERLLDILEKQVPYRLVFLHHSVGKGILYQGGLMDSLLKHGILAKGATYGSELGDYTDIPAWPDKFRNHMNEILKFKAPPDKEYSDDRSNDIVMFKSCFPNSDIAVDGSGQIMTSANFKKHFQNLESSLAGQKDKLFIYLTAPPLNPKVTTLENAKRAREFNYWLINDWLPAYKKNNDADNLVIFDLFDFLANDDNVLKNEYIGAIHDDSHPNEKANQEITAAFMQFFLPIWEQWQAKSG